MLFRSFVQAELRKLGRMRRHEKVVSLVTILSIVYWIAQNWHHLPTYLVGIFALAVFAALGILREKDFPGAVSWSFLLFLGAIFALPDIIQESNMTGWIGSLIMPTVRHVSANVLLLAVVLFLAMLLLKFTDPSGFLSMTVLFLPVSAFLKDTSVSPLVVIGALLMGGHPFWALHENYWVAMIPGFTNNQGYEEAHRLRLAHVYAVMSLLTLAVSVGYWRLIGLWH